MVTQVSSLGVICVCKTRYSYQTSFCKTYDNFSLLCKQRDDFAGKVYIVRKVKPRLHDRTRTSCIRLVILTYISLKIPVNTCISLSDANMLAQPNLG